MGRDGGRRTSFARDTVGDQPQTLLATILTPRSSVPTQSGSTLAQGVLGLREIQNEMFAPWAPPVDWTLLLLAEEGRRTGMVPESAHLAPSSQQAERVVNETLEVLPFRLLGAKVVLALGRNAESEGVTCLLSLGGYHSCLTLSAGQV